MKTVVVYRSKTGFARKYAEWIAEELAADIFEASRVSIGKLTAYDAIIYGGGVYISGINGVELITRNLDKLAGKRIAVFATGATPGREEEIREIRDKNFSQAQQEKIGFFYLRGGFDFHRLKPVDKALMTLLKWKLRMKKNPTADERGMLAAYEQPADFTRRKNIAALISYLTE